MTRRNRLTALWVAALALGAGTVQTVTAQTTDTAAQTRMAEMRTAQALLASALSRIATNGRDATALLDAGRASLTLEDPKSAASFLVRADEASPENAAVKAALGSAMLGLEDPRSALSLFERARLLGASERLFLADRGLAYDMIGDQKQAQRDYELALALSPSDETTRRYALSLGMSGQTDRAVNVLVPLLKAQDRAAWRARAFVLAMAGRTSEADEIVRATMPGELATTITPYLARMNRLTPAQQAAAVHFGTFPAESALGPPRPPVQIAAATPAPTPTPATGRVKPAATKPSAAKADPVKPVPGESPNAAAARPPAAKGPVDTRVATAISPLPGPTAASTPPATARPDPVQVAAASRATVPPAPTFSAPVQGPAVVAAASSTTAAPPTASPPTTSATPGFTPGPPVVVTLPAPQQAAIRAADTAPPPTVTTSAALPAAARTELSLDDIAASIAVPAEELAPAAGALDISDLERLRAEKRRADAAAAAEAQRKADAAKAKAEADAKAKEAADAKKRNPARAWVQVATGANANALEGDFRRLAKKYPDAFKGQAGATAEWGRTRRLLVGPFKDAKAASAWLSTYKKAGGDGFAWSSETGQIVDKIGGK